MCFCHHKSVKALLYVPIVFSLLVLGAHFLRELNVVGVAVSILLLGLLFVRRNWAARVVQAALVVGVVEWLLTLYELAGIYAVRGNSPTRMYIILGSVAALALVSALLFQTRTLRKTYRLESPSRPNAD